MRVLVWQWGRFGGGPRIALTLAQSLGELPDTKVILSLSDAAEILQGPSAPKCDLPVRTYRTRIGFLYRLALAPFRAPMLARRISRLRPDLAICAHPGPLDLFMGFALRRLRIPFVVLVHDADHHPGDGHPVQMRLQRALCRRAAAIGAFSKHVGRRLIRQGVACFPERPLIQLQMPPIPVSIPAIQPNRDGEIRLLCFGRLLKYKGLDLLAEALSHLLPRPKVTVRIVGSGPEARELDRLRRLPGVIVENRWVPEHEIGALLAWSDVLVLPYREASQSGIVALAVAAGCRIICTRVGGLAEQLAHYESAILCDPTVDSLERAISSFLKDPTRLERGSQPCVSHLWQKSANKLLKESVAATCIDRVAPVDFSAGDHSGPADRSEIRTDLRSFVALK